VQARGHYLQDDAKSRDMDDYSNTFTCIPKSVPYRPKRLHKPRVSGIQTALVVGADGKPEVPPSGDDIHTDEHGRVQAKLSWDRTDPSAPDGTETCMLRVAQQWGGQGWGFMFIPRIGMEVIVSFIDGDPDRPLVTGCVYNGLNRPHYELPAEKTKSYIMTQSTPNGGGSNELRFDDAKGSEEIYVHAQKDYNELVENNQSTTVQAEQTQTVGGNRTHTVKKNETILIEGSQKITITGKGTGEGQTVKGGQLDITGKYKLDASDQIDIQAPNKITLTVGGSSLVMEPGKITLTSGGNSTVLLDANAEVKSSGNSVLKLDANAKLNASGGGEVLLDANAKTQSAGGANVHLEGANAKLIAAAGAQLELTADAKMSGATAEVTGDSTATVGALTATLSGAAGSVEAAPTGVTASGPKVTLSGDAMVEITGALVKIN
jgi:type VI secretion system secreted protein VgrG